MYTLSTLEGGPEVFGYMILGKPFHFPKPQFPYLYNRTPQSSLPGCSGRGAGLQEVLTHCCVPGLQLGARLRQRPVCICGLIRASEGGLPLTELQWPQGWGRGDPLRPVPVLSPTP